VTPEGWAILVLVGLPLVALISLGFLVRAFVEAGGNHWLLRLLVLAFSGAVWSYFFLTEVP
jgi:hypothetical protein